MAKGSTRAGQLTGQITTSIEGNSVVLGKEIKLKGIYKRIADRTKTKAYEGLLPVGALGAYSAKSNVIILSKDATPATMIHELGHAKDYANTHLPVRSLQDRFYNLPQSEKNKIIINRYNRYTTEPVRSIAGVKARLDSQYYKYISSWTELYADSYSQYITNAKQFRKSTPKLYNFFQDTRKLGKFEGYD